MQTQMNDQLEAIKIKAQKILSTNPQQLNSDDLAETRSNIKNLLSDFQQHIKNLEVEEQNSINQIKKDLKQLQEDLVRLKENSPKKAHFIQQVIMKKTGVLALRMKEMLDVQELKN